MVALIVCASIGCKPVKRYVGTVIDVSNWDGTAKLKTKTEEGKDTIVIVKAKRFERFQEGQTITCWSGGNLIIDDCTTDPQ